MTREMYDKVCRVLTDYENPRPTDDYDNIDDYDDTDWEKVFYKLLVEVQNDSEYA